MKAVAQFLILLTISSLSLADGPAKKESKATYEEKIVFKSDWKGERIDLPTDFAPDMKLKGVEEIRFAPGMFDSKSESFFSYVFVFAVSDDQELTEKVILEETLVYYRGLAKSVLGSKGKKVDTSKFKFELKKSKETKGAPAAVADEKKVTQYAGKLDWIEPFATAEAQVLHFELQAWSDPETKRNYLFVCTSPKEADEKAEVWKEMRKIRKEFQFKGAAKK